MAGVCEAPGSMASVVRKQEADAATQLAFSLYSLVYPKQRDDATHTKGKAFHVS